MRRLSLIPAFLVLAIGVLSVAQAPLPDSLDKAAAKWVEDTFKKMTLDDKVGQLVVTSANTTYLASDTDAFESLAKKVQDLRIK